MNKRICVATIILLLVATVCQAGWYSIGNNHYSCGDGRAYTYRSGCYYYAYTIPTATAYAPPANWRSEQIKADAQLEEAAAYDRAQERRYARLDSLHVAAPLVRPSSVYASSYSSSTTYGYPSVGQLSYRSPTVNVQTLLADYQRGVDSANVAASGARSELLSVIQEQGQQNADVARINASAAAIVAGIQAAQPKQTTSRVDFQSVPQQPQTDPALPPLAAAKPKAHDDVPPSTTAMMKIVTANCASCHGGATPAKKFDVVKAITTGTDEEFQTAATKISGKVSRGEMPVDKAGVAHPLSAEQIKAVNLGLQSLGAQLNVVEAE